jgi:hypothetical protein
VTRAPDRLQSSLGSERQHALGGALAEQRGNAGRAGATKNIKDVVSRVGMASDEERDALGGDLRRVREGVVNGTGAIRRQR